MLKQLADFYKFILFLINRFFEDRGTQNAGALTYTTLFAVVPILTVVFVMLAGIPAFQGVGEDIQVFIFKNLMVTGATGSIIQDYLKDFIVQARQLTWVGVAFLIGTSFMMLVTVEHAFNNIWRVQRPRYGLQRFLLYWALLSLGPILLGAGFAVRGYVMSLAVISDSDTISSALRFSPFLLSVAGFTFIYCAIPNTKVPLRHGIISGVFAAALLELARFLFGLYVTTFHNYQLIYGAFAAVPLFLLWIYVSWVIVLFGCELSCCLGLRHYLYRKELPKLLVVIAILKLFYDAQLKGKPITPKAIQLAGWSLPDEEWTKIISFFEQEKLVCSAAEDAGWILCRDINQYSLQQLVANSPWPIPRLEQIPKDVLKQPWFAKIYEALIKMEQAEQTILGGSLASRFTVDENVKDRSTTP